jgi:hypothetical protein
MNKMKIKMMISTSAVIPIFFTTTAHGYMKISSTSKNEKQEREEIITHIELVPGRCMGRDFHIHRAGLL